MHTLGQYTKQQIHYLLYVLYQHYLKKGSVISMYDVRMIQRQLHVNCTRENYVYNLLLNTLHS